jgi:hypothetical protein
MNMIGAGRQLLPLAGAFEFVPFPFKTWLYLVTALAYVGGTWQVINLGKPKLLQMMILIDIL